MPVKAGCKAAGHLGCMLRCSRAQGWLQCKHEFARVRLQGGRQGRRRGVSRRLVLTAGALLERRPATYEVWAAHARASWAQPWLQGFGCLPLD